MMTTMVPGTPTGMQGKLLQTLERLLALPATAPKSALDQVSQLVSETLHADKVDTFLYDPAVDTLVAVGTSDTPMGRQQHALGLNRLPLSNGGRSADVFATGDCYRTGHAEQDPDELLGIKQGLGVRSILAVPLEVDGTRRGVLQADSAQPDQFTAADLDFLEAVARWVGLVLHRAELVERIAHDAAEQARRVAADELVTILAHDLRGPLTPLKGRLDLLRMRAEREGHRANLADAAAMTRTLNRLQRLIEDLLDTARLEEGIFALAPEVVDLAALARETADTLRTGDADITVRTPEELSVEVDPQRMRQALENLLSNARKHSPEGLPVILDVRVERRAEGEWAVVTVQDAGPGIASELVPKLFTRFGAGPGSTGLGLGLYLARGIAEAHGGTLTVDSTPGQGASFHLSLPLPQRRTA